MADVTISQLLSGLPSGGNIIPFSNGTNTLGVPVSAIFQKVRTIDVGTETTAGGSYINIKGGSAFLGLQSSSSVGGSYIGFGGSAGIKGTFGYSAVGQPPLADPDDLYIRNFLNTDIRFFTNYNSEKLRITNTGDVGIGITNPSSKLHVNGTTTTTDLVATGTINNPGVARAWVRFNSYRNTAGVGGLTTTTRQLSGSYNVASVTRTATGKFTILFQNPLPSTNAIVVGSLGGAVTNLAGGPGASGSVVVGTVVSTLSAYIGTWDESVSQYYDPATSSTDSATNALVSVAVFGI